MSGMPFNLQGKGGLDFVDGSNFASICSQQEAFWKQKHQQVHSFASPEPTSVLHMRRSSSPPTSASTLSSSFNNGGGSNPTGNTTNKVVNNERKDEWVTELQPIPNGLEIVSASERCGLGLEDWEDMLSEPSQEQSLLRWISADVDESFGLRQLLQGGNNPSDFTGVNGDGAGGLGVVDYHGHGFDSTSGLSSIGTNLSVFPGSALSSNNGSVKVGSCLANTVVLQDGLSSGLVCHPNLQNQIEVFEEKPQILSSQVLMDHEQSQNPNFFLPLPLENNILQPQTKKLNSGAGAGLEGFPQMIQKLASFDPQHLGFQQGVQFLNPHVRPKPVVVKKEELGGARPLHPQQQPPLQHQHPVLDQLCKAAELVVTGNFSHAQGILARLNQQLSPIGKPVHRAAFYFKEALQSLLFMNSNNSVTSLPPRSPTPFDIIFKMGAYKVFSEVSPMIHFVNFTCNQALLEALSNADRIHIIDFDIGFGAQWASFMQELPRNGGTPALKITAFASPSTIHPVEILLMRENLTQFANEIGINFELDVVNFDSLEHSCYSPIFRSSETEAIAVNFPIWSVSHQPSALPSLLRIVKQLSPKIIVSLDRGDRMDLPFPQHILHALQAHIHLLESLDAVSVASDAVNKIEKFLLQPRIENTILGRIRAPEKMPSWKTMFASAGFFPVSFSNFTETQAECVVKRTPARGFYVEKRQALLVLRWQNRDLISASAWRC